MSEKNGLKPGVASSAEARLRKLLTEKETEVHALQMTLAMLTSSAIAKKAARQTSIIDQALALDAGRRQYTKRRRRRERPKNVVAAVVVKKTRRPAGTFTALKQARRQRSAALLQHFDRTTPKTTKETGLSLEESRQLGSLFRHGYLKKKNGGWILAKEFQP